MNDTHPSRTLATFAATLRFDDIPYTVISRAEDLLLDWTGSALAGKAGRPVQAIAAFAQQMGPDTGPCEVLINRRTTSALFAAMVNAASSHFAEQDDVHNGSVFHPGAVVFPVALALAQSLGASGRDLLTAVVAGYEVGIRVGEFLGRSHYKIFHTTGTAGTIAAAAAAGHLLKLTPEQMLHAFGSAGTSAAGQAYLAENVAGYSTGAAAAPVVGALAGIAGGVYGGRMISGGYAAFGGSGNTAVNVGTAIGTAILPGIGSLVGGLIGGVVNRAFGMSAKKATTQGVRGTLTAEGFDGENYANWTQKGGWFRSNKSGTDTSAVDAGVSTIFTDTYAKLKTVSSDFAIRKNWTSSSRRMQRPTKPRSPRSSAAWPIRSPRSWCPA